MTDPPLEFDAARITLETSVRSVQWRDELPSTNDLALELATGVPDTDLPMLVLATRQTGGRGRGAHRWWAGPGALTFSLLLDTVAWDLTPRKWPQISLGTGIAVANTLENFLVEPKSTSPSISESLPTALRAASPIRLKWPNDVFVGDRKICGILTENVARQPQRLVIGIGLNVNNSWQAAPTELQAVGTSMGDISGHAFSLDDVLITLLQQLQKTLAEIATDTFPLAESWRALCLLEGRTVTVEVGQRKTTGVCHGIDDDGALLLQTNGGIQQCVAGTVAKIH